MRRKNGFTLIELLVVVAIIALLVAILVPAVNEARAVALRAVCGTRLHGLIIIMLEYAHDYDGKFPCPEFNQCMGNVGLEAGPILDSVYGAKEEIVRCPTFPGKIGDEYIGDPNYIGGRPPWGWRLPYFMMTSMQDGGHGGSIPESFDEAPATIYEDPDKIIACDFVFRVERDWLQYWGNLYTCHQDPSTGQPDGANTGFLDGSITWFDADELGPAAEGIDTEIGNYDYAWWDYGTRSYFWGVRGQYRKAPGWQPTPGW